ncbi:MAG: hypothetical protein Q7R81_02905 [Candidatus Peregrinibacteria bacterium]|nr:hypothetical protein [Candidatus Peregrinibacteria bacterium]
MDHKQTPKILIIDSHDCPGVAHGFCSKFQRHGLEVTLSSDDTDNFDKETMILPLLEKQKFDVILFLCSEAYNWDDQRWQVVTFDWSILGWKKRSINADTPLIAVTTAPDDETISRFKEVGVTGVIDRGDKPSAKQVSSRVFAELAMRDVLVAG